MACKELYLENMLGFDLFSFQFIPFFIAKLLWFRFKILIQKWFFEIVYSICQDN